MKILTKKKIILTKNTSKLLNFLFVRVYFFMEFKFQTFAVPNILFPSQDQSDNIIFRETERYNINNSYDERKNMFASTFLSSSEQSICFYNTAIRCYLLLFSVWCRLIACVRVLCVCKQFHSILIYLFIYLFVSFCICNMNWVSVRMRMKVLFLCVNLSKSALKTIFSIEKY